jgi:hypothetical protein
LADAGAGQGSLYGCCSDAELYAAMLAPDRAHLGHIVQALADAFARTEVDYVVADALEGFNPSHDLCRFLVNASVAVARKATGQELHNFDFLLDGSPTACPEHLRGAAVTLELTDDDLDRKLAAAKGYPELRGETESALARFGAAAFRTECLRPVVDTRQGLDGMEHEPPYYERYGEQQVAAGHYDRVIRYRTHLQPLVHGLWDDVGLNGHHRG